MHSEISNEYNFDNELDITQNKRDKTEHFFSKEGFAIEDFMSINKTKSEKDNRNNSELQRREDSTLQNNFMDYLTDNTVKSRKNTSFVQPLPLPSPLGSVTNFASPKFADSSLPNPKKEFTLRRGETTDDRNKSRSHIPIVPISMAPVQKQAAFKRKSNTHEQQYLQIEKQTRFLQDSLERMVYQSHRLEEDTQNLMNSFSSADYDKQMDQLGQEIRKINGDIEQQRNLEAQLTRMLAQLNEEHEGVTAALRSNMFPRPTLVKDEAKAIIDDINLLRAQFEALQRDDGSLNLSSTLFQPPQSVSASPRQPEDNLQIKNRLQEISEQNRRSEDPRFLSNLKLACLRDEWNLFANRQILVQVSYRQFPRIRLQVGNKSIYDLDKFSLKQEGKAKMQGQCVAARSYLLHEIQSSRSLAQILFIKCEISYVVQGNSRQAVLFIPTGLTNFGEFAPVTEKEFAMDAGKEAFECVGAYRPMERQLLSQLSEIEVYWPNLLVDREGQIARGLHVSGWGDYVLVELKQRGQLLSVGLRTPNWPLLRLLEFLLSN